MDQKDPNTVSGLLKLHLRENRLLTAESLSVLLPHVESRDVVGHLAIELSGSQGVKILTPSHTHMHTHAHVHTHTHTHTPTHTHTHTHTHHLQVWVTMFESHCVHSSIGNINGLQGLLLGRIKAAHHVTPSTGDAQVLAVQRAAEMRAWLIADLLQVVLIMRVI